MLPIAFMGDLAGQWFQPFALTIDCSVLASLFVSFSLDPMVSAYWRNLIGTHAAGTASRGALERVGRKRPLRLHRPLTVPSSVELRDRTLEKEPCRVVL